jgi:Ca2+-binding RTX toxin-like protein
MSFLRKGGRRAKVGVTIFSLVAFQALAVITAGVASAVTQCTYNPATDTINITIDPNISAGVAVETADDNLDAESAPGAILFDEGDGNGFEGAAGESQSCGSATNSNTVAIIVLGSPNADETFFIDELSGDPFNTAIAWNIDMGGNTVGGVDILGIFLNDDQDNTLTATNGSFDLNGAIGEVLGVEQYDFDGGDGDDVIDASAVTFVVARLHGHGGTDLILPGTANDNDTSGGGDPGDTLSYGNRTTSVLVDVPNGEAGHDADGDGTLGHVATDEVDGISGFDTYVTGTGGDTLIGGATAETFVPGDGDDSIDGNGGVDTLDYSSSSAGMVIDPGLGTATGQGADTFADVEGFIGSAFDDTLIWPTGGVTLFAGGDGVDTVDATARTTGQVIDLDTLDGVPVAGVGATPDTTENALGGSGNDTLIGNDLRNNLEGNDGDDTLAGAAGNDTLTGGLGNDTFSGGTGADRVSYATNTTSGINADMNLGFITSAESGDDGFAGAVDVEIVQGSPFNDAITGGGGLTTINFLFSGGAGKDRLTGSGSNDTLRGGAGNDKLRGLEGGDTLKGGPGNDRGWGGPGVDFCAGVEREVGCEG